MSTNLSGLILAVRNILLTAITATARATTMAAATINTIMAATTRVHTTMTSTVSTTAAMAAIAE